MARLPSLGPRGVGWVLLQGILFVAILGSATVGGAWSGPLRLAGVLAGTALVGPAAWMVARGVRDLGAAMTPLPRPREGVDLVRSGIYARVRHPIYGGLVIGALGWALIWASAPGLVLAAVTWAFFTLKSMREEAWLVERYPDYAAYRTHTRRFIPWFGRARG